MAVFQPPPTWALPIIEDKATGEYAFNTVWLKWFVDLVGVINASGGGSGAVQHNSTLGLQGGTTNEFYHFTSAQNALLVVITAAGSALIDDLTAAAQRTTLGSTTVGDAVFVAATAAAARTAIVVVGTDYTTAPFAITPPGSVVAYQNATGFPLDVIISGGTVTLIEFSRDGATWYTIGLTAGVIPLSPSDRVRVTYSAAPIMTGVPR